MLQQFNLQSPGVLPDPIREWAIALAIKSGVSFEFALMTLLSAMASAVCGLKVVERPDGGIEQTSLIVFAQAPPAYGKTRLYKHVFKAHQAMDVKRLTAFIAATSRVRKGGSRGSAGSDDLELRLRLTMLQDTSKFGLLEVIHGIGESVSLSTHEGNLILNSNLFRNDGLEMATTLWDGEGTIQTNRRGKVMVAMKATANILVMVQDDVREAYCKKHGEHARSIGFFSRTLFVNAPAWRNAPFYPVPVQGDCLADYYDRVQTFLSRKFDRMERASLQPTSTQGPEAGADDLNAVDGCGSEAGVYEQDSAEFTADEPTFDQEVLALTPEAANLYFELQQEMQRNWSGHLYMQDALDRAMQNVLRIAGIMQAFVDDRAPVSAAVLNAAYHVVDFCLGQFSAVFPPEPIKFAPCKLIRIKIPPQQRAAQRVREDAQAIVDGVCALCQLRKEADVPVSDVRERLGIYPLRFRAGLALLEDEARVLLTGKGREMRISIVPSNTGNPAPHNWPEVGH
jgi:hypothetical protein